MLDSISSRLGSLVALEPRKPAAPEATVMAPRTQPGVPAGDAHAAAETGSVARSLAQSAPVDASRVSELRQALKAGNYPVQPERIAAEMIASLGA